MSAMEHLIMQIFDRKSWIEGQLRHQSQSYDESLAYNLLAQGKQPPPWLWPTGSNGCDLPDPKGQNSDRLHSGMLFSLPCAVTPSVKNSTYVTLPVFKGYEVSQPNKPTETHASEYVFSECSEKLVPSASKLTSDRITEPEVLARAVFIPCECEQYSNSRQREEEICSSGSESASHLGQSSNMEIYTGRMIRSRAHTSTPDDVRESPDMNSSLHHLNRDGDRVTLSRARSAAKANHIDQMLQSLGPSSSIENGLRKAVGSQSDMSSVPSVNLEHISCTTSTCIPGTVAMELLRADNVGESSTIMTLNDSLHPHNGDDSRVTRLRFRSKAQTDYLDKLSESVKPLNCIEGTLKVVESQTEIPSIQNFDHLQTGITESAVLSTTSPVHSCLKIPSVEPMFLLDGIEEHGLNKSSDIPSLKKKQCSVGVVLTNLEAVSVNEELLCKYCEKVDGDEKDVFQNSIDEGVRSTHCGRNQDGELLEVENSRSHSYITPGVQSFHQDVNKKSSLEILAEVQQSIKLKEVMSGLDYMPAKTNSPIDPEHPACDSKENNSLAINCSTSLEKGTKKNVNVLKSKKEAFGSIPVQIDSSSLNSQPEEILATVELMSGTEEANIAVQEKLDLSNSLKSDLISLPESNHRDSHVSTISYLDSGSMNPESYPTCSALDAECLSFSDGQIFLSDGCKSSSFGASTMCPIEENFREKLITETSSIYIQTICNVQNGGSALPSQTDELLEASVGEGNSSINSKKFFGSCKSSDPVIPLKSAAVCLSAHAMSMGIKEGTFAEKSRSPKTLSSQHKVPYLLRSSASVTGNCGSILANGCASCSEKNSLPPSDINLQCPENLTGKKVNCSWVTPNSIEAQSAQAKSRYCLRSLNSHDRNVASIKDASHLKQPNENITRKSEISWPKRRKVGHISNNILATSPKLRFKHFSHIQDSSDCSSNNKTSSEVEFQPVPMSAESETGILYTVSASLCKSLDHSKERHTMEGIPYLNHNGQISVTPLLSEHAQDELCDIADRKSEISLKDDIRVSEASIYKSQIHSLSEDCHDSLCETIRSPNGHQELREDGESNNTLMSSRVHNTASFPEYGHALVGFDENMPEFEGFSIAFPSAVEDDTISSDSNFPTLAKERASALDELCKPKEVNSPLMCTSWKHKIHKVPECYQSLPAGLLESLSSLHFNDQDMKHPKESDNDQLTGLYDNSELEFGYSLVGRQYPFSIPSSSTRSNMEFKKPPLTPPLMKFGQKVVSHSSGASSEKVGSNPELVCFRIDENSSIADENGHIDELEDFKEGSSLTKSKDLINRKALRDISVEFQNKPILGTRPKRILDRESLESVNSVLSVHLSPAKGCTSQRESKVELKENSDLTVNKKVRKAALSLRNRSNKPRVSQRTTERSRSHGNVEKGCKPSNVVTNISSFIPLVRQKQQAAAPLRGSKDIKVKALEAAEAAKRIEEKKQNEREMRKAAAKLEREKMEQENIRQMVLKQKQKEEERKKEAEIAARKRHREEEGRKEKERKRRCTEETRRQKKEEGNFRAGKDEKQHRKEKLEAVKVQLKLEKIGCQKSTVMQPSITEVSTVDDRNDGAMHEAHNYLHKSSIIEKVVTSPDRLHKVVRTRASIKKESGDVQSYEMSPYIDSDNEDGDNESRRESKCIPLWARRECLDQIILSKRDLDPTEVFSRKRSFIIGTVLPSANLRHLVK